MVGLYSEPLPEGFGFSDTAFRVFILMASRRLKSDRFFTRDYRPEVYSPRGVRVGEADDDEGRAAAPLPGARARAARRHERVRAVEGRRRRRRVFRAGEAGNRQPPTNRSGGPHAQTHLARHRGGGGAGHSDCPVGDRSDRHAQRLEVPGPVRRSPPSRGHGLDATRPASWSTSTRARSPTPASSRSRW